MPNNHRADLAKLVKRVHALSDTLVGVSSEAELKELIKILKRPGWTTPAEMYLALGIVNSLIAQVRAFGQLKTALLRGSRAVR